MACAMNRQVPEFGGYFASSMMACAMNRQVPEFGGYFASSMMACAINRQVPEFGGYFASSMMACAINRQVPKFGGCFASSMACAIYTIHVFHAHSFPSYMHTGTPLTSPPNPHTHTVPLLYSNKNGEKAGSDVIVLSDEDSPTSPVTDKTDKKPGVSINAHQSGDGGEDGSKVVVLRELLQQEEQKLTMLKQIRTLQDTPSENSVAASPSVVVARSSQSKPNIVVVPGNQKSLSVSNASTASGISSRLQHLVDTIAVDQALNSQHLNSGSRLIKPAPSSQLHATVPPPLTSTPLTLASTQQSIPKQKSLNLLNQALIHNLVTPSMRLPGITGNSLAKEVITISDSPSPVSTKNPPPLLPTTSATNVAAAWRLGTLSMSSSGSIQVPTISSTIAKSQAQAITLAETSGKNKDLVLQQVVENSKRYRDYLMKQLHVRRSFQKQMEKRITIAPYPKTFRQVWPVIPVHDATFVRNFGLESIFLHFDPNKKMMQEKATAASKVKPVCNQCGCDFASAWQIRKSNSKQLLLCEACDFHNLKVLQRSKLANQLKELVESIKKEEEKFHSECEEARNQVVALEKQTLLASQSQRPPPLTSQLTQPQQKGNLGLGALNPTSLTNHVITATGQPSGKQGSTSEASRGEVVVVRNEQPRAVVPSILPKAGGLQQASVVEVPSRKRKEAPGSHSLPSKAYKPGSTLDLTLNKLTQQLIKRKLDEQREERRQLQEAESAESERGKKDTSPPSVAGAESRKNRRKGTPRHKRHLSSSSVTSE